MTVLVIDTTGLTCPMPFLRLRRAMRDLDAGALVDVLSTDPLAPGDFAELCQAQGHRIVSSTIQGPVTQTRIEVQTAVAAPRLPSGD